MGRLYAIGDVHGCARTLDALLVEIDADAGGALGSDDTVVFVGDYVDRGPDSPGVLDRMIELEAVQGGAEYVFLRGNHDQMMLEYAEGTGDTELWWINGGRTTLSAYDARGSLSIPPEHVAFLRRTVLAVERGGFAFVHAGLDTRKTVGENLADPDPAIALWTRKHLDANLSAWEMPVVCGHTPVTEPINESRLIGIDTGAVFPNRPGLGRLTAVSLPDRRFLSVETAEVATY